jgi:hypothetical protein
VVEKQEVERSQWLERKGIKLKMNIYSKQILACSEELQISARQLSVLVGEYQMLELLWLYVRPPRAADALCCCRRRLKAVKQSLLSLAR